MTRLERMQDELASEQRALKIQEYQFRIHARALGEHAEEGEHDRPVHERAEEIHGCANEVLRCVRVITELRGRIAAIRDCIEIEEDKR